MERYRQITEGLEASMIGLVGGGRLGEIFSEQTDHPMAMDRPVVFDVSNIDDSETSLQAAVLLACWSYGFGAVDWTPSRPRMVTGRAPWLRTVIPKVKGASGSNG